MVDTFAYCLMNTVVWRVWTWSELSQEIGYILEEKKPEEIINEVKKKVMEDNPNIDEEKLEQIIKDIMNDLDNAEGDVCTFDELYATVLKAFIDLYMK